MCIYYLHTNVITGVYTEHKVFTLFCCRPNVRVEGICLKLSIPLHSCLSTMSSHLVLPALRDLPRPLPSPPCVPALFGRRLSANPSLSASLSQPNV